MSQQATSLVKKMDVSCPSVGVFDVSIVERVDGVSIIFCSAYIRLKYLICFTSSTNKKRVTEPKVGLGFF